ncbi:hypothetical protein BHE74_00029138, partial [Ensete ventricosum]
CVGSSLRVSKVCQDSIREFARRRPRLTERLSGVAEKLAGNDRPRSSLGIGLGSDDVVGSRRSLLGDSSKGSGSLLGTRREITGRLAARMLEAVGLVGIRKRVMLALLRAVEPQCKKRQLLLIEPTDEFE